MLKRTLHTIGVSLGLVLMSCPVHASQPSAETLRIGISKVDITPERPVSLEGYSNLEERVFLKIHDRIYARAFVFQEGSKRMVLVSADVSGFALNTFPSFQKPILQKFGLEPDEFFLVGIHTHSGPLVSLNKTWPSPNEFRYTEQLRDKLMAAVDQAMSNLQPARIRVSYGNSDISVSRREPTGDGRVKLGSNPDATIDRQVIVVGMVNRKARGIAALFNFQCHSRSLKSESRWLSGDVLGIAEQTAERILGPNHPIAAFPGASGDVDPRVVGCDFPSDPSAASETDLLGIRLGQEVARLVTSAQPLQRAGPIRTSAAVIQVPGRWKATLPIKLTVARIGDLAFAGIECEVFNEIGARIKEGSPFKPTVILSMCNGGAGYLVPAHCYAEGGYEVGITPFAPEAAALVEAKILEMLHSVAGAID